MTLTATRFFLTPPEQLSAEVEDRFFSAIRTDNRTTKQTAHGRFDDVDRRVGAHLASGTRPVRTLLDVAISSGVTTIALADTLARAGLVPAITATDRRLHARIVPLGLGCAALIDADDNLLQLELFGRAMRPWRRRLDYLTGMAIVRRAVTALAVQRARRLLRQSAAAAQPVLLATPRLAQRGDIRLIEDDILVRNADFVARFDLVRAANILTRRYFDDATLACGVDHLLSYLSGPGAWLLVNRTWPTGENRGTLFRLGRDGRDLRVVERFGGGSEIEPLVLAQSRRRERRVS